MGCDGLNERYKKCHKPAIYKCADSGSETLFLCEDHKQEICCKWEGVEVVRIDCSGAEIIDMAC